MKKLTTLLVFLLFVSLSVFSDPVDVNTAQTVAQYFFSHNTSIQVTNLTLAYSEKINDGSSAYFIFNINQNDGFIIVSGDDAALPILGYSNTGHYDTNKLQPIFVKWMEGYKQQILYIKANNLQTDDNIQNKWESYKNNQFSNARSTTTVNPLLTTTWNQQPYYNDMCPWDNAASKNCVTGCPATAMAQIMKYWNYPAQGTGNHSYGSNYGTLSANFANTTYDWASMPNYVSSTNNAVATLMYHCGVAVEMSYSANSSGAYVIINSPTPEANSEYAYKTYFGYNASTLQGLKRENYTDVNWIALLKIELNASRPIQYAGFGGGSGHTFVCDGYDANDYFHFNWGWGGQLDGNFLIDALNPGGSGTGAGTGTYNQGQQAVIGIQPPTGGTTVSIEMFSSITITPNPINFAQPFTVNADVQNVGSSNFNGDFCAALFNSSGDFIDYVQIISTSGNPLPPTYHYTGGLTFSNVGMLTVPGNYTIGIYYRPTGGNWHIAGSTSYTNYVNVNIKGPYNTLKLYSNIIASPTTLVQGQSVSVNVNLWNTNSYTYFGQYAAALYDLNGNLVQTIGTYNETTGLPANYSYSSPYITFPTSTITVNPGTYILAILEKESSSSNWYLAGGDNFTNPINIDVVDPALLPDVYENNNTVATAYNLALSFSGNTSTKNTTGSNIHIGSDYDNYKIVLPSGYNYQITARVHDSYNSGNGNTYTCDVSFSYSNDNGSTWSDIYDNIMPNNISVNNGGTIIFNVSPYFVGLVGTYLLDLSIVRTVNSAIKEVTNDNNIKVFPVPTSNTISLELKNSDLKFGKVIIQNNLGQITKEFLNQNLSLQLIDFDVSDLPNGIYYIQVQDDKQKAINKKFIINR